MKKIILLGAFISTCIILIASSASAVEYRAVIEQNTKEIISQETTIDINTVSEKLTKLIPTMKITHEHILVLLILKFIRLIFSTMRTFFGMPVTILLLILLIIGAPLNIIIGIPVPILLLILLLIIRAPFNLSKIFRLIIFMMRTIVRISGLVLIQILKIIRFPFKLISKSITLLINLIRLIILLPNLRIGSYRHLLTDLREDSAR